MANETRSLWEQLDSEVEPWRRGRSFLIGIGLFQMLAQLYTLMIMAFAVSVERNTLFAVGCVLFWLFFYFVWIGINWMRWLWGTWDLIAGFCTLMWGWTNSNSIEIAVGSITFIVGFILCFSPSIYFFAQRQREHVRWLEAVLTAGVCLLLLASIAMALVGFIALREDWRKDATSFAMEANHRIYQDRDFDWVRARAQRRLISATTGPERLQDFLSSEFGAAWSCEFIRRAAIKNFHSRFMAA